MIKRLFIDTKIILDFLGERKPFYLPIAKLATLADKKQVELVVSSISFATVNCFLAKYETLSIAKDKLRKFKIISEIFKIDEQTIDKGLNSSFKDFEDALQYFCALDANCDIIITRNAKDFKHSVLPVMTADEFLSSVKN